MAQPSIPYKVSYRDVKYPRLEFKTGRLLFVLPFGFEVETLWDKYKGWILKKNEFIQKCLRSKPNKKIVERTEEEFRDLVRFVVKKTLKELNEDLNKIYFRTMKTKWASCSARENLTINRLMKYLPDHLLSYIIFHEIAHLKERRHNDKFWEIVSRKFNNWKELEKDLFMYWFKVANQKASE